MSAKKPSLAHAIEELKTVLNARSGEKQDWPRRVAEILARIEQSARRHRDQLGDAEGRVVDVDTSLNPSPKVARRTDELRRELDDLLHEAQRLHEKTRTLHPVSTDMNPATAAGALSVAPEAGDIADLGVFRERVEKLLDAFAEFNEEETDLIQESVTLDLGAGD